MLKADFFVRVGMFVMERFLDTESCRRLRAEMRASTTAPATIGQGGGEVIDEDSRRASWSSVSVESRSWVHARLRQLKPDLERHFDVGLDDCEIPQFLVYRVGDFYAAHTDGADRPNLPDYVRLRRLSMIVFLNGQSENDEDESYRGGVLTFSRLIDDPRLRTHAYPLIGKTGLLVAFRSDQIHAVSPVTRGERYTIASWFV